MDTMRPLMEWYASNCDGDWEHTFGVNIQTSDNPGWIFRVDILETNVEGKTLLEESIDDDDNWYYVKSDGKVFEACGDPTKLQFLLEQFAKFIS